MHFNGNSISCTFAHMKHSHIDLFDHTKQKLFLMALLIFIEIDICAWLLMIFNDTFSVFEL